MLIKTKHSFISVTAAKKCFLNEVQSELFLAGILLTNFKFFGEQATQSKTTPQKMKPEVLSLHTKPITALKYNKEGNLLFAASKDQYARFKKNSKNSPYFLKMYS